jgi:multidrug efflux pump subunit AcrB
MLGSIAAFAVRQWQFTLVAFALLAALGINSILTITRSQNPFLRFPYVQMFAFMPGSDARDMEELVAKPLEDIIDGIDSVKQITSTNTDGVTALTVEFEWGVDPERKFDQVVREVNAIRGTLPASIQAIRIEKSEPTKAAFLQVALVSPTLPWRRLEKIADTLRENIDRVHGVQESKIWGAPASEIRVSVDLGRLSELQLPLQTLTDALRRAGADVPIGSLQAGNRRYNIKTLGSYRSLDQVAEVPLVASAGRVVRVRDVATVAWANDEQTYIASYNGQRAMFVTARQQLDTDVINIMGDVNKVLDDYEKRLPADVKLVRAFDQSKTVKDNLGHLGRDFAIALALVIITLIPLGGRASLIVMVSIPLSLLLGVTLLKWTGFSLNQLSIAGFVLALGLLVDDTIVVTENIARHLRMGLSRTEAAVVATRQISVAVLGCTACLMLAFIPLLAMPEAAGKFIRSMPAAVLYTIASSLLVSITIIPFLSSWLLKREDHPEGNALLRKVNGAIHTLYRPLLHSALLRPWRTLMVLLILCALTIPVLKIIGSSLFPPIGTPQFLVHVELPDGATIEKTTAAVRAVDAILHTSKHVEWTMSNVGRGNPQIQYNLFPHESKSNYGDIFVQLDKWDGAKSVAHLDTLRAKFDQVTGARVRIELFVHAQPIEAPIAVRIIGPDLQVLKRLGGEAEAILKATTGVRDVGNPMRLDRTDLNLGINEAKAATLGVPAGAARQVARLALSGETVGQYRDPDGDDYAVRVRLPLDVRNSFASLDKIYVPTASGSAMPLSQIATPTLESGPATISRRGRERLVTVTANIESGYLTQRVSDAVYANIKSGLKLPSGYTIDAGGEAEAQSKSLGGLGTAIIIALLGILAVLTLEFGRFKTVLVVAGVLPLGVFGAVLALWLTGNSLSFTASIGIIALIGIEIKNSILLVDFTEQLRKEGVGLSEAIERAGETRFLPVLLTSITAIGGLLPLAFEDSGLFSPMAIAIIGGLLTSTFLSRIATPVMYLLVSRNDEKRRLKLRDPAGATVVI